MTTRSEPRAAAAAPALAAGLLLVLVALPSALLAGCTSSSASSDDATGRPAAGGRALPARTFAAASGDFPVCDWAADGVAAGRLGEVAARTPAGADTRFAASWECSLTLQGGARLRVSVQPRADVAAAAAELAERRRPAAGADSLASVAGVGDEAFSFSGFGVTGVTARQGSVVLDVVVARQPAGDPWDGDRLVPVARRLAATVGQVPVPAA